MYSYGWRDYMPDLGRWNGIDQLAESYHSISPYIYVANNPVSNTDPDGRWIYEDGSIGQAPSTWSMLGPKYKPYLSYSTSYGMGYNGGAGVSGAYSFTGNNAATMFNYFANGGNMSGMTFKNGWAMWGTLEGNPFLEGYDGDMYVSNTGSVILHKARLQNNSYEPSFFGDFFEGARYADKSNLQSGSAWTGYMGFYTTKYEKLFHYTAKISSSLADKASALKSAKGFAYAGKGLGIAGVLLTVKEDYDQNGKLGVGTAVKVGIGLATTFAAGALPPWALAYVIADVAVGLATGTTITDRIAAGVENTIIGRLNN